MTALRINKIWHPFTVWEESTQGMWRQVSLKHREMLLKWAIEFTGDHKLYGKWMRVVLKEWPISCEQNLSDYNINRRAWIGHAAVCIAMDIPEDIVREAWGHLTDRQRNFADKQADKAIAIWENLHESKTRKIHKQVGLPGIPVRDTRRGSGKARSYGQGPVLQKYLQGNFEKRHSINQLGLF